jgi:hypothetical protein
MTVGFLLDCVKEQVALGQALSGRGAGHAIPKAGDGPQD